jgi:hypothetical protein
MRAVTSSPHSIPSVTPRFRVTHGTVLTAFGVLVAIALTLMILTLTSATSPTVPPPVTASHAGGGTPPAVRFLGPRQLQDAALNASRGTTSAADASNQAAPSPWQSRNGTTR